MRVIEPSQFRKPFKKKRPLRSLVVIILVILLAGYGSLAYAKLLPSIPGRAAALAAPATTAPELQWPAAGQAAFGTADYGILAESGAQTTAPMASIAKVMTALAVLQAKPLKLGEQGPLLTIGEADIQSYHDYVAQGGSVVAVNSGETISEYQALQALLLPSANNMADTLVRWAFDSPEAYLKQADQLVKSLGLSQTAITDTSGFSSNTKSTPHDLVLLGIAALHNPVLAEIVQQPTATIPVAGEIENINGLLGQNGINGIKTGNTEEAGGCLLFSSNQTFSNGKQLTLVGAIMGAPTLGQAQRDALSLLRSTMAGFRVRPVLGKQTVVGTYQTSWGSSAEAIVNNDVNMLLWADQKPQFKANLNEIKVATKKGAAVGALRIEANGLQQTVPVILRSAIKPPPTAWRLSHFFRRH